MQSIDKLYESLASSASDDGDKAKALATRASQLSHVREHVNADDTNEKVRAVFVSDDKLEAVAVVENGIPIGLINRNNFMEHFAKPFAKEVFGRKSCIAFMHKFPLIIDRDTPVESLVKAAVEAGPHVLKDGFITTTADGQYDGMGTGFGLMTAMSDIEAEKTRQLLSSISYASLIQRSHLVESDLTLKNYLPRHGLLWEPRDVVGGDAYFFRKTDSGLVGCMFDCTGHGVPGAFMTLIALSFLEQSVESHGGSLQPGETLARMNAYIRRVLQQNKDEAQAQGEAGKESNDGLDAAIFRLAPDESYIDFASAKLGLMIAKPDGTVATLEGDKHGIGYSDTPPDAEWTTQRFEIQGGRHLLGITTDGVIDQVGGPKSIAHGKRRLVQFLSDHREKDSQTVCNMFSSHFQEWQGTQRRRDDVSLFLFEAG